MKTRSLAVLALALTACGALPREEATGLPMLQLEPMLQAQVALYPNMQPADLYKLLHQATMGPAHLFMGTASHLETGLTKEIRDIKPSPTTGEREIEVINPTANLARINLRPFLLNGGKVEDLARAIARTDHAFRGEAVELRASLATAADLVEPLGFAFTREEFRRLARDMDAKGFPSGQHSRVYADTYEPAYRLVILTYFEDPEFGGRIDALADEAREAKSN